MLRTPSTAALLLAAFVSIPAGAETPVDLQWGVKIPMRDGVELQATLYRPQGQNEGLPCILSLTPYIAQNIIDRGFNTNPGFVIP